MASEIAESIRNILNKNSVATSSVLIIVIVAVLIYAAYSLGFLGRKSGPDPATTKAFFIDEETGEIEVHMANEIPPLVGKSGKPTVVRAFFFTNSTDEAKKFVYLERYTPEGKQAAETLRTGQPPTAELLESLRRGMQVRSPEPNAPWYYVQTPEGQNVVNAIGTLDPDISKIRPVNPK